MKLKAKIRQRQQNHGFASHAYLDLQSRHFVSYVRIVTVLLNVQVFFIP